eukprot:3041153-Alexandrium_andersonii.AAC.1
MRDRPPWTPSLELTPSWARPRPKPRHGLRWPNILRPAAQRLQPGSEEGVSFGYVLAEPGCSDWAGCPRPVGR